MNPCEKPEQLPALPASTGWAPFSSSGFSVSLCELTEVKTLYLTGHYLHRARVGRQLNYKIEKDGKLMGAICYALPMMRTGYFGYTSNQMLEFARLFLTQNIRGLAVWAIAQTLRRVERDWTASFPQAVKPELVVSWHDTHHHQGTVYKAASFMFYRTTKPRKRGKNRYGANFKGTRGYTQDDAHIKGTWLFPLNKRCRKLLVSALPNA